MIKGRKKEENEQLRVLKKLNPAQMWVFVILRSLCKQDGRVDAPMTTIQACLGGSNLGNGLELRLSVSALKERMNELTYLGILEPLGGQYKINDKLKQKSTGRPITIAAPFLQFIPPYYLDRQQAEEAAILKLKLSKADEMRKSLNDTIRRLREEVRVARQVFVPEFKMYKKDGTIDERSVQYQRLWSWFVLLNIQQAFEKIVPRGPERQLKKEPDYRTIAVWLSMFGMDIVESLLAKFYMSKRLDDLKEEAGDRWPGVVLRFIYGSLKRAVQNRKPEELESAYVPRHKPKSY